MFLHVETSSELYHCNPKGAFSTIRFENVFVDTSSKLKTPKYVVFLGRQVNECHEVFNTIM